MSGIKEAHWQCFHCHRMIGPKNRVEIKGEWFHISEDHPQALPRNWKWARLIGCGPIEPVLAKERLIAHLRECHDGLPHDPESEPPALEAMTLSRLYHFHGWVHEHDELELRPEDFDPEHVASYFVANTSETYVDEGWWHPNVKGGQVHDHKPNMPMTMHRTCEPVFTRRST